MIVHARICVVRRAAARCVRGIAVVGVKGVSARIFYLKLTVLVHGYLHAVVFVVVLKCLSVCRVVGVFGGIVGSLGGIKCSLFGSIRRICVQSGLCGIASRFRCIKSRF